MLYQILSLIISGAGFIAVVITLVVLIRQTRAMMRQTQEMILQTQEMMRQTQEMAAQTQYVAKSLKDSVLGNFDNRAITLDQVFIEHPEIRPYFYNGKDIHDDDPGYDQVIAVADLILDFFDSIILRSKDFPEAYLRENWEDYIVDMFTGSPVLTQHLEKIKDWHSPDLFAIMTRSTKAKEQALVLR